MRRVTPAAQRERGNRSKDDVAALHAQNERLRLENERLRMLLEDKGAPSSGPVPTAILMRQ